MSGIGKSVETEDSGFLGLQGSEDNGEGLFNVYGLAFGGGCSVLKLMAVMVTQFCDSAENC